MSLVKDKNFYTRLLMLALPIVLQQFLRISVDTINSIMLGSIDQIQMSAVAQANQIFFIYYTICNGFSVGCAVLVAQYFGKNDEKSINTIIAHGIRIVGILGLSIATLVFIFPSSLMRIYASDASIIELGSKYLRLICLMYPFCAISVMIFGASRGVGQLKIILKTNIVSYSINILLDYIFIFGKFGFPALGIMGVAYGTIVARIIEFIVCAIFFIRDKNIPFKLSDIKKYNKDLRNDLLKVSAPIVAHEIVWSFGTSTASMITGQLGRSVVAGYNVAVVLYDLCASFGHSLMNAGAIIIGITIGESKIDLVKKQAITILFIALIMGICLGLITYSVKYSFLGLYALEDSARNYAVQFMNINTIIWPFSMLEMVTMAGILRAGGDGKIGFITDIIVMWFICIPLASLAAFKLTLAPVFVVGIIKLIIVLESIVGVSRVLSMKWIKNLTHVY